MIDNLKIRQNTDAASDIRLELVQVRDPATRHAAESLDREYLLWIAATAMQNFGLPLDVEAMIRSDIDEKDKFYPPSGRFYLLRDSAEYVGIGCLKRLTAEVCELERMYVRPALQRHGLGRMILNRLLDDAAAIGYKKVRLESLKALAPAHAMYHSMGFRDINHYAESGMKDSHSPDMLERFKSSVYFMELDMAERKN